MDLLKLYDRLQRGTTKGTCGLSLIDELVDGIDKDQILRCNALTRSLDQVRISAPRFQSENIKVLPFSYHKLFHFKGDRQTYEKEYFSRRQRLLVLTLHCWLWDNGPEVGIMLEALEDCIWAICDEYTWSLPAHMHGTSMNLRCDRISVPVHHKEEPRPTFESALNLDLFACETGFALAEACALLRHTLNPLVLDRAILEVKRRVIDNFLSQQSLQQWEMMDNNWCAVSASSIAGAALYLSSNDLTIATIMARLSPTFNRYLDSFHNDGCCSEGLAYWTYGVSFFVSFADLLCRRTDGAIDLLDNTRFKKIALFQQKCHLGGGATVAFSDAERRDGFRPGMTCYLAEKYNEVQVPAGETIQVLDPVPAHFAPALRDFIWAKDDLINNPAKLENVRFEEAQWLICHSGDLSLAAKGGHNDEEHNHNDVGSFTLFKAGRMILCDLGKGLYTRDYFGPERYTVFCNSSFSHSVPIINGTGQSAGREYAAKSVSISESGREMVMDIADAYDCVNISQILRRISLFDGLMIHDTFDGEEAAITERFISLIEPSIENGHASIDGMVMRTNYRPKIGAQKSVDHGGNTEIVYTIDYEVTENEFVLKMF